MFTPEYAVSAFRNILNQSVNALEREVSYASNQLETLQTEMLTRARFADIDYEMQCAVADALTMVGAARSALLFLARENAGLCDYDLDNRDRVNEAFDSISTIQSAYADLMAEKEAARLEA